MHQGEVWWWCSWISREYIIYTNTSCVHTTSDCNTIFISKSEKRERLLICCDCWCVCTRVGDECGTGGVHNTCSWWCFECTMSTMYPKFSPNSWTQRWSEYGLLLCCAARVKNEMWWREKIANCKWTKVAQCWSKKTKHKAQIPTIRASGILHESSRVSNKESRLGLNKRTWQQDLRESCAGSLKY